MKKKSTSQSAFFNLRILTASVFCLLAIAVALFAQGKGTKQTQQNNRSTGAQDAPGTQRPDVVQMVGPVMLNTNLRDLPYVAPKEEFEERVLTRYPRGTGAPPAVAPPSAWLQKLLKGIFRPTPTMPGPLLTFDGLTAGQACACAPPDSDGDVGPNHYVEAVNVAFRVFDKTGTPLSPVTTYNSFFSSLTGTPCANANDGDPFAFYDHLADRWVITDFAFPTFPGTSFWECIGVSQSPDPVAGPWALYAIQIDPANPAQLGDYPKFAMWDSGGNPAQNAYFFTVNLFTTPTTFVGVRAFALDRASMLGGNPANAIAFTVPLAGVGDSYSFVGATFRTGDPPPTGRNEMFLAIDSPSTGGVTLTQVHARFFHVDFVTPANSTFGVGANHTPNAEITVDPFVDAFTNAAGFTIVPQSGTSQHIDTLGDKIMTPLVYQNRGGTESLWASGTVCQDANCTQPTGVRWYQVDVTGGNFPATPAQQQTWTNGGDGLYRFMSSIAVDNSGNTAIGYSVSSSTEHPGIRYAGRLEGDPPGNLGQGEATMFTGAGSETDTNGRWGDYSYTSIDPSDGMTFWHVNEYEPTTGSFNWSTRIGKFDFVVGGTPTPTPTATPALCTWSAGPDMPTVLIRAVGVYFPDGNFYTVGGRTADTAGSDFQHVLKFDTTSNTWTQMPSTLADNQGNNMACGVLTVSGTPLIYCVGGSAAGQTTAAARVYSYDPATDTQTVLTPADDWPGDAIGTILPGGFAVANNKFYILGGFNINVASTNEIWEFDPNAAVGSRWTQKVNTPVGIMYAPTCTINGIIYVGGASDFQGGLVVDTTNSFSFDPVANTIGTIAPIPRATGETRALNFNGQMYVMGGGRVAPNPSNEVDVYDPGANTWSTGIPFVNGRRNFPTDTNGTDHIWLSGGYDVTGVPTASMEIFTCPQVSPTPTPTATATPTPRETPTPRPRPTPHPRPTP